MATKGGHKRTSGSQTCGSLAVLQLCCCARKQPLRPGGLALQSVAAGQGADPGGGGSSLAAEAEATRRERHTRGLFWVMEVLHVASVLGPPGGVAGLPCCLLPTSSPTELPSELNFVFSWGRVPLVVP